MKLAAHLLLISSLVGTSQAARADVVALTLSHPRRSELSEELGHELSGFGHEVRLLDDGLTELAAEQAATALGAHVLVGPGPDDGLRIRAWRLSPRGVVEDARLPAPLDQVPARVFANVAAGAVLHVLNEHITAKAVAPVGEPWKERSYIAKAAPAEPEPKRRRFFARLGPNVGLLALNNSQTADSSLNAETLERASTPGDPGQTKAALRREGYDCDVETTGGDQIVASNCGPYLAAPGFVYRPAAELVLGAMLTERVGFSFSARIAGRSGRNGGLNRALLGLQVEVELLPHGAPVSLRLVAGPGVGHMRARAQGRGPYITSGIGEVHGGLVATLPLFSALGIYASAQARRLFPDPMTVLDFGAGLSWAP